MNIERAIARNRHHMSKAQIGWVDRYDEIVHLVGFRMVTPSEFSFAEEVGRWQRDHGLNPDGIIGPTTWERMQPLLGQGLGGGQRLLQPPPGPQTFAGARPGEISVDRSLLGQNREIENGLFLASRNYLQNGDLRWFFALAHATITQQINDNIGRFQRPNALIRLNLHFAQAFLRAVNSLEGEEWKQAFRVCQALQRGSEETMALVGETEICAGAMADVHIFIDLKRAIREVGCIPPEDYGNVQIGRAHV